jgi:Ca2+-binding RTX toxin-like protein
MNEGADTVDGTTNTSAMTVVGGNDSADGSDSIFTGAGADLLFGNGGNDTLFARTGANTIVAGFGNDLTDSDGGSSLQFGNEGNDSLTTFDTSNNTVFGGLGNDSIRMTVNGGRDTLQGNEGNDTIAGNAAIDTISGGSGNDVFSYAEFGAGADGDNAAGGGPVELITDVNWAEDKFDTATQVTFATNTGAGTGVDLNASANNAIAAAFALAGGGATVAAAQFTFAGRTYVAIDQAGLGTFVDAQDLLLDITGVTGTIATSNFI